MGEDLDLVGAEAADTQQRAQLTRSDSDAKRNEVTGIVVGMQPTEQLVANAMGRVQQAEQIEQNVSLSLRSGNRNLFLSLKFRKLGTHFHMPVAYYKPIYD